ncbi:unnamed protein product (macronuclear) [Paramecium tetraurelia]|uniref:Uncharacterized protein n=1 Tax=Paramecium tetraurelia TaxID=5888 RepID=A0CI38_PARTE|nr:uncharacterized protein GSPATT00038559001 [Paramecium tetraurelia]CAK70455.1 unnamed protein product [Paramecium tetraurelia]|eukprot:XP_001437852.1 hypothetical protein (macronuclear) [Paramecium tetraurelia strain d4-2]
MNSLVKERDQSEIMILNNLEVQSQIKSSIFQSKLQQSIQNIRQLSKPIAMHIEPQILPLRKLNQETPIKKSEHQKSSSYKHTTLTKGTQVENQADSTQKLVQNQFDFSYSYRKQDSQMRKSTDYQRIFEHYHHSTIVQMISSYEECFNILVESNEAQLLRIPTNLILAILREREELQHQCVMLRRKLYQLDRASEQYERVQQQHA